MLKKIKFVLLFFVTCFFGRKIYGASTQTLLQPNLALKNITETKTTATTEVIPPLDRLKTKALKIEQLHLDNVTCEDDAHAKIPDLFNAIIKDTALQLTEKKTGFELISLGNTNQARMLQLARLLAVEPNNKIRYELFYFYRDLQTILGLDKAFGRTLIRTFDTVSFWGKIKHCETMFFKFGKIAGVVFLALKIVAYSKKLGKTHCSGSDTNAVTSHQARIKKLEDEIVWFNIHRDSVINSLAG